MNEAELARRLERLERDNRQFKRLAVAALVIAAAIGTMAATRPVPQKIVAHEFVLEDAQGKTQAILGHPTGYPGLLILDRRGKPRAEFAVNRNGVPSLTMMDGKTKAGPYLTMGSDGSSALALYDDQGNTRAALSVGPDGSPSLQLFDAAGFQSVMGVTDLVTPTTGETHKTSAASLVMFDNNHRVIWQAPN